ncbi:hypothetical protein [Sediminicola luteus]|uniref:Uncharacterized protein n=1 Tax=Sediminicola luteus TaxID=319238 RepID=A0ABV2TZW6_9FLAO
MSKTDKLLKRIIPPPTREEREGFSNQKLLAELSPQELENVEKGLIEMLADQDDFLIGETLVFLNSEWSIPGLRDRLKKASSTFEKIKWVSLVNDLRNGNSEMEKIAYEEFQKLEFLYEIDGIVFMDLIKFDSERINKKIEQFVDHKYFLVAHHAKMVLNYKGYADNYDKETVTKKWWEVWK